MFIRSEAWEDYNIVLRWKKLTIKPGNNTVDIDIDDAKRLVANAHFLSLEITKSDTLSIDEVIFDPVDATADDIIKEIDLLIPEWDEILKISEPVKEVVFNSKVDAVKFSIQNAIENGWDILIDNVDWTITDEEQAEIDKLVDYAKSQWAVIVFKDVEKENRRIWFDINKTEDKVSKPVEVAKKKVEVAKKKK